LFWVVGTFAVGLPKSGRWMEWVKSAFGLVMIGSALYFLRAWLPGYRSIEQSATHLALGIALLSTGLLLGAVHLSFSQAGSARLRKVVGIATASAGILITVGYLEARPAHADWEHDLAHARERALAAGSPLLIDFGASWCQACGELERHTFSDARVVEEARRFVKVKVDLSPGADTERGKEWLKSYGARGLPLVVLHDSRGHEQARVTEFVAADRMLELLRAID
jgi:thioredoxin:protein disulfide reductase